MPTIYCNKIFLSFNTTSEKSYETIITNKQQCNEYFFCVPINEQTNAIHSILYRKHLVVCFRRAHQFHYICNSVIF